MQRTFRPGDIARPLVRVVITALFATGLLIRPADAQTPADTIAFVGAQVFDGERVLPSATVVIRGGLISAVGADVAAPAGATVIDGRGKTLMPGFIDAHIHNRGPEALADALRFGVTTVLDMGAPPPSVAGLRPLRERLDHAAGADLYSAGNMATSPGGHGTQYGLPIPTLTTPAEAQAWVDARIAEGSDYIKIIYQADWHQMGFTPSLDRPTMAALIAAAHARGKLAVVHVHSLKAGREAIEDGADGLVHLFADAPADQAFVELARARGAFIIPTMAVIAGVTGRPDAAALAADPAVAPFLSADQRTGLSGAQVAMPPMLFQWTMAMGSIRALNAGGVDILAGTDVPNPGTAFGVSVHQEMEHLTQGGLTPAQALRAATSLAAARFRLADRGRIAAGLRADLVLVEGDPLTDVQATRAIVGVWKSGQAVSRPPAL